MSTNVQSDIAGSVWKIEQTPGTRVAEGDTLLILESMKMEIPVEAPRAGVLSSILVAEGDTVAEGQVLLIID